MKNINTPKNIKLLNLWKHVFVELFYHVESIDKLTLHNKLIEPKEKENLAGELIKSDLEYVKMSSGSGAFRVKYAGENEALKNLFIKGYYHKRLFDPTNLYKRFSVRIFSKYSRLCISNTRIFNEIIMNYLLKKITTTDTTLDEEDKNNIHTYDFMYTPDKNTIYIAQPAIGHKALIADGNTVTTLKDLLEAYYIKLKEDIRSPYTHDKQDTSLNDIKNISVALCNALTPYLKTLQKLRKKYKFVHTDLHFGNIFIKSKPDSEKKEVSIFQNILKKPIKSNPPKHLPNIHEQLINDLENCVLLIADYDLARITVEPHIFNSNDTNREQLFPGVVDIDFKSIFIERKAIKEKAFGVNVVPKEKKKLQKKETVIRTRCAYEEYSTIYKDLYPSDMDDKKFADMLIYSNWDILSIFINVMAFLKKCEYKIYKGPSTFKDESRKLYAPIIVLFQDYVVKPIAPEHSNHIEVANNLIHIFYACMNYMYRDKSLGNWVAFLFEGKFSFITRVFDKFKNDYHIDGIIKIDNYITQSEESKGRPIFKALKNILTRKVRSKKLTVKIPTVSRSTKSVRVTEHVKPASRSTTHSVSNQLSPLAFTEVSKKFTTEHMFNRSKKPTNLPTNNLKPLHFSRKSIHKQMELPVVERRKTTAPITEANTSTAPEARTTTRRLSSVRQPSRTSLRTSENMIDRIPSIKASLKSKLHMLFENNKSKKSSKLINDNQSKKISKKISIRGSNKVKLRKQIEELNMGTGVNALRKKFELLAKVNKI